MADLTVNIAGVEFKNPVITASGTFGFGREYSEFYPLREIGGLSCKGITLKPRWVIRRENRRDPVWDFKRRRPAKSRRGSFYRAGPALAQGAGNGCDRQYCREHAGGIRPNGGKAL